MSDIKRANGLLSDTAMFARGTLLIPKKPLPVGYVCTDKLVIHLQNFCKPPALTNIPGSVFELEIEHTYASTVCRAEYSTWAGMIVLQYGKLQAKERCPAQVGCDKYGGQRTSIDDLRGYYSTSPAASPKSNSG